MEELLVAWQDLYKGHHRYCIVVLEAVADQGMRIWHSFFGMAESHNDIIVLHRSQVFMKLMEGYAPPCNYEINVHSYTEGFYLDQMKSHFAECRESCRHFMWPSIDLDFLVPCCSYLVSRHMWEVMHVCVFMHSMIIESDRKT
jgi:hypothetical protein